MRRAFSILELAITLAILGIVVAIAAPRFAASAQRARFPSTIATFQGIGRAADFYRLDFGAYPPDFYNKNPHIAFRSYLDNRVFLRPTPLGGDWDWNNSYNASGAPVPGWKAVGPNVSINFAAANFPSPPTSRMLDFDVYADDGSLTSGRWQRHSSRMFILPWNE